MTTTLDSIINEKHFNLLRFALFITRLTTNTVSIENVAMLDQNAKALEAWLKFDSHWKHLFPDKSFSSLLTIKRFQSKE